MWSISNYLRYSILTLLVLMAAIGSVSATASVFISPESHTGLSPGETFNVDINVESGVELLHAAHIKLHYDSAAFEVIDITKGSIFDSDLLVEPESGDDGDGTINYGFAAYETNLAPGSGTLISVEFETKDITEGVYGLSFVEAKLLDQSKEYLVGKATGSSLVVGDIADDTSTSLDIIDLDRPTQSTSSSSSSTSTVEKVTSQQQYEEQLGYAYSFGFHPDDHKIIKRNGVALNGDAWSQNSLILENEILTEFEGQHLFPQGKIISIGTNSAGYLTVIFYEPLMVDQSEIDEIYAIIDRKAQAMDIDNVPVEFGDGTVSDVSDGLQQLIQRVQVINKMELEDFMNNESQLYDPMVVATAGKIPQIRTEKECWQWYFQDSYVISLNASDEVDDYLQSGILLSTGLSPDGYLEVNINEEADVDIKSLINDIYETMNKEAVAIGLSEVPVVFKLVNPDEMKEKLASSQDDVLEGEDVPGNEDESQATPGFGFFMGFLSLSIICCIKGVFEKGKP
ncbi:cohesin domain-containing protein [Methanolobus sp. ZRKC5]|uniref:cohesin domain-containing protein n=1 Tax=unclassified Methanolobus TaxID=2629569 RepID=UPI00313B74E2